MSLLKICTPQRSLWSRNRPTGSPQMKSLGSPQRLLGSLAASQFEGIKNLFSCTERKFHTPLSNSLTGMRWGFTQVWNGRAQRWPSRWRRTRQSPLWRLSNLGTATRGIWRTSPNVCEPVQVHFWREQGARRGCHDSSGDDQHEDAWRQPDHHGDVLLHWEEAPGQL